ncbi:MAG: hypothetical protein QOK28_2620 [Actinomycetota bacterium]|jgi:hypothetical protein
MKKRLCLAGGVALALICGIGAAPASAIKIADTVEISEDQPLPPVLANGSVDTSQINGVTKLLSICITSHTLGGKQCIKI